MNRISVVIPTHNRAITLDRALASVMAQTRTPDEVIVVDDASTDSTAQTLRRYPSVIVVRLDQAGGAGHARNQGVRRASGDFVAFLDSDDEWRPDKLATQVTAAKQSGAHLVCTGVEVHGVRGAVREYSLAGLAPAEGWSFAEYLSYPFSPSTWLIRRSAFEQAGGFDATLGNCEDLDLLARLTGRHRMQALPQSLVVKHNLADSLDADLTRTSASYEILFARYPTLWARSPRAATTALVRLASMHMQAHNRARARHALWRAIRGEPLTAFAWTLLGATFLGPELYQRAWRRLVWARSA